MRFYGESCRLRLHQHQRLRADVEPSDWPEDAGSGPVCDHGNSRRASSISVNTYHGRKTTSISTDDPSAKLATAGTADSTYLPTGVKPKDLLVITLATCQFAGVRPHDSWPL